MNITIEALQAYLSDRYGGWANEQGLFMKLVEEIGEVAEVLNKRAGRKSSDESDLQEKLGTELADMLHYIVAIAAINNIALNDIVLRKDRVASIKYHHKTNLETFLLNRQG
ncbi:MAG: MazG nucleotide pyrophosphohydrolase domain-containing protein [Eubacteriales bacterium]